MHILGGTVLKYVNLVEHILLLHIPSKNTESLSRLDIGWRVNIEEWVIFIEEQAKLIRLLLIWGRCRILCLYMP